MIRRLCAVLGCAFLLLSCRGPVEGLVGEYEAEARGAGAQAARLNLRSDGGGALGVGAEDAPFRWEMKEGQVLLHTRQGGILALRRSSEGLETDVPGAGHLVFRKK